MIFWTGSSSVSPPMPDEAILVEAAMVWRGRAEKPLKKTRRLDSVNWGNPFRNSADRRRPIRRVKTQNRRSWACQNWNRQRGRPCLLLNEAVLDEATIVRLTKPKEDEARRSAYAWTTSYLEVWWVRNQDMKWPTSDGVNLSEVRRATAKAK